MSIWPSRRSRRNDKSSGPMCAFGITERNARAQRQGYMNLYLPMNRQLGTFQRIVMRESNVYMGESGTD